ncbi:MAG: hypothetical protein R2764_16175 [Bacteroidales bacterium]
MKRIIFILVVSSLALITYAQYWGQKAMAYQPEEVIIGESYFDLQTYASCQNRIYLYDDETLGAVFTYGMDHTYYPDRGTGYIYFDGSEWGPWPWERIESQRTGWSCYAPLGENGEVVLTHLSGAVDEGLLFSKREVKGSGDWTETVFHGPGGYEAIFFPRMVTGGINNNSIFLLANTYGNSQYQGLSGALLYSRSMDGGETWDILNQVLPGMDSTEYSGFSWDCYAFAEPRNNIVAFVVGSYQHDLFLMKSTDYGETFEKTLIWDHPYDEVSPSTSLEAFYSVDGSLDISIDPYGKAHVVFGIVRTYYSAEDEYWHYYKLTDGIGYWNESMNSFSSNINALNPTNHPESELVKDESLIAWSQDMDGDSVITFLNIPEPYVDFYHSLGASSMVQLIADEQNRLFLIYTSITETWDNGWMNYRRLWIRSSLNGGQTWGKFYHYDGENPNSIFNEYAFPSCSPNSDDNIYLLFQTDVQPGIYRTEWPPHYNNWKAAKIPKDEIVGINKNNQPTAEFEVSQNFPNPFSESTTINVNLQNRQLLNLR